MKPCMLVDIAILMLTILVGCYIDRSRQDSFSGRIGSNSAFICVVRM